MADDHPAMEPDARAAPRGADEAGEAGEAAMTGRWQVHHGDARRLMSALEPASVDLVLTDPPYSSGGFTRGDRTGGTGSKYLRGADTGVDFAGDNRDQRSFTLWCELWMVECMRVMKPGAILASFIDWRQLPALTDAMQCAGLVWRGISSWVKPNGRPQQGRPAADTEFIVWGTRGARPLEGSPGPRSAYMDARRSSERLHQTEKPVQLLQEWCKLAPRDGLILDPFCGSGSTGEAALTTGRRFVGYEITAAYHQVAHKRLSGVGAHGEPVSHEQGSLFEAAS